MKDGRGDMVWFFAVIGGDEIWFVENDAGLDIVVAWATDGISPDFISDEIDNPFVSHDMIAFEVHSSGIDTLKYQTKGHVN